MNVRNKLKIFDVSKIVYRFISTLLFLNIINLITNNFYYGIDFMQQISIFLIFMEILIIFGILSVLAYFLKIKYFDYFLTISLLFICSLFWLSDNNIFFITVICLLFLLLYYFRPKDLNITF